MGRWVAGGIPAAATDFQTLNFVRQSRMSYLSSYTTSLGARSSESTIPTKIEKELERERERGREREEREALLLRYSV